MPVVMSRWALLPLLIAFGAPRPAAATVANDICPAAANPCLVTTMKNVTNNSVLDFGNRDLVIGKVDNNGSLNLGNGTVEIRAGSLTIAPKGRIIANAGDQGAATLTVKVQRNIDIQTSPGGGDRGDIDATSSLGGGNILLCSPDCAATSGGGTIRIDGDVLVQTPLSGLGGTVQIVANTFDLTARGAILAYSGGEGGGGSIDIETTTGDLTVEGKINVQGGTGGAGDVSLDAGGHLVTKPSSSILANDIGDTGDGFLVELFSHLDATIGASIDGSAKGNQVGLGGGGADIEVIADNSVTVTASMKTDGGVPDGDAGDIDIDVGINLAQTGALSAQSPGVQGFGGSVSFEVPGAVFVGPINASGGSSGGEIFVDASGAVVVTGALDASATVAAVDSTGGTIDISGCGITIAAGASLTCLMSGGVNGLHAGGQITVNGPLTAGDSNVIEFGDPGKIPIINATITPPTQPQFVPLGAGPCSAVTTSTSTSTTTSTSHGTTSTTHTTTPGSSSTTSSSMSVPTTSQPGATSTSSSTLPVPACDPAAPGACDDDDLCTEDVCDPGTRTCTFTDKVEYEAVYCRLDEIDDLLSAAPPASVGGQRLQLKLKTKILNTRHKTQAAESAHLSGSARQEHARLVRAGKLLDAFTKKLQHNASRIDPELSAEVLQLAEAGKSRLQGLTP